MRKLLWWLIGLWVLLFLWRVLVPAYPVWLPYALIGVTGIGVAAAFLGAMGLVLALPEALFDRLEAE